MDVFEEALAECGLPIAFENNIFACELQREPEETVPLLLSVYRDLSEVSLGISVTIRHSIPESPSPDFVSALAEQALDPLRGGVGIGIFPGTTRLALYQRIPLSGLPKGAVMKVIEQLVEAAEDWDSRLSQEC
jgi:hypothetical protein